MGRLLDEYNAYRDKMNARIMAADSKPIKRLYNLDTVTYAEGALPARIKEMLGLAASMVLRCDDCIKYHVLKCRDLGVSRDELFEVFSVACTVGGTIVVPHLRRAVEFLEELEAQ